MSDLSPQQADSLALRSDWEQVGQDMRTAMMVFDAQEAPYAHRG